MTNAALGKKEGQYLTGNEKVRLVLRGIQERYELTGKTVFRITLYLLSGNNILTNEEVVTVLKRLQEEGILSIQGYRFYDDDDEKNFLLVNYPNVLDLRESDPPSTEIEFRERLETLLSELDIYGKPGDEIVLKIIPKQLLIFREQLSSRIPQDQITFQDEIPALRFRETSIPIDRGSFQYYICKLCFRKWGDSCTSTDILDLYGGEGTSRSIRDATRQLNIKIREQTGIVGFFHYSKENVRIRYTTTK